MKYSFVPRREQAEIECGTKKSVHEGARKGVSDYEEEGRERERDRE